ncbi:hypothetical protein C8R45DRAFT_933129 [Mycena sanguinolenta]|nr:hypothetical protein C8R45DRAFT_933129 [Mycena sanguinolenta]
MRRREMNLNFDAPDVNTDIQLRHTSAVGHRRIQAALQTSWVSKACPVPYPAIRARSLWNRSDDSGKDRWMRGGANLLSGLNATGSAPVFGASRRRWGLRRDVPSTTLVDMALLARVLSQCWKVTVWVEACTDGRRVVAAFVARHKVFVLRLDFDSKPQTDIIYTDRDVYECEVPTVFDIITCIQSSLSIIGGVSCEAAATRGRHPGLHIAAAGWKHQRLTRRHSVLLTSAARFFMSAAMRGLDANSHTACSSRACGEPGLDAISVEMWGDDAGIHSVVGE